VENIAAIDRLSDLWHHVAKKICFMVCRMQYMPAQHSTSVQPAFTHC